MENANSNSLEEAVVNIIQMGLDPNQDQEVFYENLNILESIPELPFSLLKIISDQGSDTIIRINSISILRRNLYKIEEEFIYNFCQEADDKLFYALQIPFSELVREIAILCAEIYDAFKKIKWIPPIFPFLNEKLVETIQIPSFIENSLFFAIEFANVHYNNIGSIFISYLPNLVIGEFSEYSIQLASLLTVHSDTFEETLIPIIFENISELSDESLKFTCDLVGKIIKDDRNEALIEFIIQCISNANDSVVYAAVEAIQEKELIPYREDIIYCLFKRLGNDFNLCESNVSCICLEELQNLYYLHLNSLKIHPFLMGLINEAIENGDDNEDELRCAIRCFSFMKFDDDDEVGKCLEALSNFLSTTDFCCDSSYSMTRITKRHPIFFPRTFDAVFQVLSSESFEIRFQIFNYLSDLSIEISPILSDEIKGELQSEPYLEILLQMIQNDEISYEEFVEVLKLIGSFCSIVQSFDPDNFTALIEMTIEILNRNSEFAVECLHIFSSIIDKEKDAFCQLFELIGPISWSFLEEQSEDIDILNYCMHFFSKSIESAFKFQFLNDEFNKAIVPVCEFAFNCVNPFSEIGSLLAQKAGWTFFYQLILYDTALFDQIRSQIFDLLVCVIPSYNLSDLQIHELFLRVISIKCQLIIVFVDRCSEFSEDDLKKLIFVSIRGLKLNVGLNEDDFQICMLCYLRLAVKIPNIEFDNDILDDARLLIEYDYIRDEKMLDEIKKCLNELLGGENEEEQD